MHTLYSLSLFLYKLGIRIASVWNAKARLWIDGRKNIFGNLETGLQKRSGKSIWMHCASLGEFEQGRPLLEAIRKTYPSHFIMLTFFSPSGYEIRKNYPGADYVSYLPVDSKENAEKFMELVEPGIAIFIKYEFWFHYLNTLKKHQIPTLLVSAIFREGQPFFSNHGRFWRKMLDCFNHIFVQDNNSFSLLEKIGYAKQVTISGDTRFDRVLDISMHQVSLPDIEFFCGNSPVLVAGSTWLEDEEILDHYANIHPDLRCIIAPHEIDDTHIHDIERLFKNSVRYSNFSIAFKAGNQHTLATSNNILIMDNMGMLSKLYRYATVTYVGGGFGGAGIHNILEAVVYGKPVIFGPVNHKSREAQDLQALGAAFTVNNALELESLLNALLSNHGRCEMLGNIALSYVQQESGATGKIMQYIQENRLLTN